MVVVVVVVDVVVLVVAVVVVGVVVVDVAVVGVVVVFATFIGDILIYFKIKILMCRMSQNCDTVRSSYINLCTILIMLVDQHIFLLRTKLSYTYRQHISCLYM